MDADTTTPETGGALGFQRAVGPGLFGKVDDTPGHKRHFLRSRTANDLPFPIQGKGLLVKVCAPSEPARLCNTPPGRRCVLAPDGYSNRPDRCATLSKP